MPPVGRESASPPVGRDGASPPVGLEGWWAPFGLPAGRELEVTPHLAGARSCAPRLSPVELDGAEVGAGRAPRRRWSTPRWGEVEEEAGAR